jgi:pilus assembly protein Flp/PilA
LQKRQSECVRLVFTQKTIRIRLSSIISFHYKKLKRKEANTMLFSLHERGQGMVEYALILVLIALVVITALTIMGPILKNTYNTINSKL